MPRLLWLRTSLTVAPVARTKLSPAIAWPLSVFTAPILSPCLTRLLAPSSTKLTCGSLARIASSISITSRGILQPSRGMSRAGLARGHADGEDAVAEEDGMHGPYRLTR